jgi:hypothetical protein
LADAQPLERRDLVDDVLFHRVLLSRVGQRSTRVDSEPYLAEKCKAIRDKKERFLSRETWRAEAGFLRSCPGRNRQLVGRGRGAVREPLPRPSPEERPGKTPVFQVGESSHGPRYSLRDGWGSRSCIETRSGCDRGEETVR